MFLLLSAAACQISSSPTTSRQGQAIIGGSQASIGDFPTVVAVHNDESGDVCTGVLIAPAAVLTAAHCVPYSNETSRQQTIAATYVYIDTIYWDYYHPTGRKITATDVIKHPDYISVTSSINGKHDVAIISLATAVTDRPVARVARVGAPTSGTAFTLVGYGIYNVAKTWSNLLHSVSDTNFDCQTKDVPNADFLCFDRTDGVGACAGDSGSPVFYEGDHGPEVVGIHAWGSAANCGGFAADTRANQQLDFIIDVLGDSFVCATDGVCESSCGVVDQDCIECDEDSDCSGEAICDAGECVLVPPPPDGTPGGLDDPTKDPSPNDPSQPHAADESGAAGCNAGDAAPGSLLGIIAMAFAFRRR